jgi:diguanylate cyclase (GGDEF)-like protein
MELKAYLRILARKWWIVLPAFLVTFTSTVVFTFTQAPVYEAKTTYVVTPNDAFENFAYGLDLLSRRAEIASTYAEVASSYLIKNLAADELGLSLEQRESLSIESRLLAGTNVLEIAAQGNDPVLVRDFANTVGAKTVAYVEDLYETYNLRSLDQAEQPLFPIEPNRKLNLALGGILGLVLGVGLAVLSEYLQAPLESVTNFGILDDETGVYNKRYFMQRLKEEMSRAKRNSYPMSLALMNVDCLGVMDTASPQIRSEALRRVAVLLKQYLRDEDVVARLDGAVFAVLLPDMSGERAKEAIEWLQTRIAWTPFELEKSGIKLNLCGIAGVVAYQYNGTGQNELLAQATRALEEAETAGYGQVCLLAENGDPLSISGSEK